MNNYRSHFETEMQITQFVELYLALTMSNDVHTGVDVHYRPQSLTFSIVLHIEYDGIKIGVCYDHLDESSDANDITDVMQALIEELRDKYGKEVSRNLLRRSYKYDI